MAERVTIISSLNNPRIKDVVKLNNRRQREARKLTVVEGRRETVRALQAGVVPEEIYVCPELLAEDAGVSEAIRKVVQGNVTQYYEVTQPVFKKIAYRGDSGGVLLVIPYLEHTLAEFNELQRSFLVVIDGVEKPGNLGAILRTSDAAGVDGLILTSEEGKGTDLHNPNVIRASLGAVFTVPVVSTGIDEARAWLKAHNIQIVAATPEAEVPYTAVPLTGPVVVVLGSESDGLGDHWLQAADARVRIPMFGVVDSLNLSVSTALMLYEVVRQRYDDSTHKTANS